jgi:hypothetical protein
MSKKIVISEDTLKMLISMAYEEGFKLASHIINDTNIKDSSIKIAERIIESLESKYPE